MAPSLNPGDRLLLLRVPPRLPLPSRLLLPGRIVAVFGGATGWTTGADDDRVMFVKRVVARPGMLSPVRVQGVAVGEVVPPHGLVVLGDCEPVSVDSRHWGVVPRTSLTGLVLTRIHRAPGQRPRI